MAGCLGDDKKLGPYTTGECQTIELALKELQLLIDTYHENDTAILSWNFFQMSQQLNL